MPTPAYGADLSKGAEEVAARLRAVTRSLADAEVFAALEADTARAAHRTAERWEETERLLQAQLRPTALDSLESSWDAFRSDLDSVSNRVDARATQRDADLDSLAALHASWSRTLDLARSADAPPELLDRAQSALAMIGTVRGAVEQRRAKLLVLQDATSRALQTCDEARARIQDVRRAAIERVVTPQQPPLWRSGPSLRPELAAGFSLASGLAVEGQNIAAVRGDLSRRRRALGARGPRPHGAVASGALDDLGWRFHRVGVGVRPADALRLGDPPRPVDHASLPAESAVRLSTGDAGRGDGRHRVRPAPDRRHAPVTAALRVRGPAVLQSRHQRAADAGASGAGGEGGGNAGDHPAPPLGRGAARGRDPPEYWRGVDLEGREDVRAHRRVSAAPSRRWRPSSATSIWPTFSAPGCSTACSSRSACSPSASRSMAWCRSALEHGPLARLRTATRHRAMIARRARRALDVAAVALWVFFMLGRFSMLEPVSAGLAAIFDAHLRVGELDLLGLPRARLRGRGDRRHRRDPRGGDAARGGRLLADDAAARGPLRALDAHPLRIPARRLSARARHPRPRPHAHHRAGQRAGTRARLRAPGGDEQLRVGVDPAVRTAGPGRRLGRDGRSSPARSCASASARAPSAPRRAPR